MMKRAYRKEGKDVAGMIPPVVLPGRKKEFALLLPTAFIYSTSLGLITVLVPLLAHAMGAREAAVGMIVAIPGVLQVVMRAPSGVLSAALGKRTMFLAAFLCAVGVGLAYMILPNYAWFVLPQLLFGCASASFWPSQWAYASELCHAERRSASLGFTSAAVGLGSFLGPYLGGMLSDQIGPQRAFLVYGATGAIGIILTLCLPRGKKPIEFPPLSRIFGGALRDSRRLMAIPQVSLAVLCMLLAATTWGINNAFYALRVRAIGYSATVGGALLAVHGATSTFARIGFGALARRGSLRLYLLGGTFLNALGMFIMPLFHALAGMGLVTFLSGLGFGMMYPAAATTIADHTEGDDRVLGMGVFGTAMSAGLLLSPMIFGIVAQAAGIGAAFHLGNLAVMIGTAVLFGRESRLRPLPGPRAVPPLARDGGPSVNGPDA